MGETDCDIAQAIGGYSHLKSVWAANVTVNLIPPATRYGARINQLDIRIAKIVRFGRARTQFGVDLYNATNTDTPLSYNMTFVPGGQWLTPTSVTTARFVKVGGQFDF